MPRKGLALIVVVGVLGVLSVLAVAFVTMAQLERKASAQRVYAARAYLLAKSGIEDALARLGMGQDPAYGGEDWNGDGLLSPGVETGAQVYQPGVLNVADCPVRHALRPSFFTHDGAGLPVLQPVDGRSRGYSGLLSGDQAPAGNTYAIKMSSGGNKGFYVNGGDPSASPATGYNGVLRRILGTLADAIDREDGAGDGNPVAQADGWALIDQRPPSGWSSFTQIRASALGGSQAKLAAFQPYLTLSAWTDKRVIKPNVTDGTGGTVNMVDKSYHSWGEIKLDHALNHAVVPDNTSHAPDFERIPVSPPGNIVGRAPVDLNWARKSRPALIALLANLKGLYLSEWECEPVDVQESNSPPYPPADRLGVLKTAAITLDWTQPTDDCRTAVSAILASTRALSTWQQWNDFCDTLPMTGTSDAPQAKRDILKANFNPNSDLNPFNPDPSMWRSVDKSDLLVYSTEFGLAPARGGRVNCMGRVLDIQGRLLAGRTMTATIRGPGVVRLSTQKDFVSESLDLDNPGNDANPRLPGTTPYITPNKAPGGEASWGQGLPAAPAGLSLQSYPEPYVDPGGGLGISPADYDGSLRLASLETAKGQFYSVDTMSPAPPVLDMKMLATFTSGFDLSVAEAFPANSLGSRNLPDAQQVPTSLLRTGLLQEASAGSGMINTLYPDGAYSEQGRAPAWPDLNNANGFHGVLSFWTKPAWTYHHSDIPTSWCGHQYVKWTNFTDLAPADLKPGCSNQFFFIGDAYTYSVNNPVFEMGRDFVLHLEVGHESPMPGGPNEHEFATNDYPMTPRRWRLITAYYDFGSASANHCGQILIDDGASAMNQGSADVYDIQRPSPKGEGLRKVGPEADRAIPIQALIAP